MCELRLEGSVWTLYLKAQLVRLISESWTVYSPRWSGDVDSVRNALFGAIASRPAKLKSRIEAVSG